MIKYAIVRVKENRVVAVLVEKKRMSEPDAGKLIRCIEHELSLPVMLVSPDTSAIAGARAYAEFDAMPYLYELLQMREVDWSLLRGERCHGEKA